MNKLSDTQLLSRAERLARIASVEKWDLLVIGGGITGAGIFKRASQLGLKVLLIEQNDFAWGSSSRSSKMVHGGLRYLTEGQVKLTWESVQERQKLIEGSQGLVKAQSFALSHYKKKFPWPWIFNFLLFIYDLFAGKKQHAYWSQDSYQFLAPGLKNEQALGGTQFVDAMTDDARLVLRLIQESQQVGNLAVNYVKAIELEKDNGRVVGVIVKAAENELAISIKSKITINATGAWANQLFEKEVADQLPFKLRPLRGSHLIVASWRLPVATAISVRHPLDKRPVQIFPWQNVTVIGTTDVEHCEDINLEPKISQDEMNYLLDCVAFQFPATKLTAVDIISTYAGIRPVIAGSGLVAPSKEKREHSFYEQAGLISITGGKLTTFRIIAEQALNRVKDELSITSQLIDECFESDIFESSKLNQNPLINHHILQQLYANYGQLAEQIVEQNPKSELTPVGYSLSLWSELIWALKFEQVLHLDDLLLRRTRIGNVLPKGGLAEMNKIKSLCHQYLDWDENKWDMEFDRYQKLWKSCYSLPKED